MAEFLINTEAELAKVTWTSRKRLIRDSGVVLLTVLFFAVFLYLLDIIWVLVLTALELSDEEHRRLNGDVERVIRKNGQPRDELLKEVATVLAACLEHRTAASTVEATEP